MQKENEAMTGLDSLNKIIDRMHRSIPKEQEEVYEVLNKEIGQLHSSVENKVNELYKNIINNFNRTALNVLNHQQLIERQRDAREVNSMKQIYESNSASKSKKQSKQNLFELVSKKMILGSLNNKSQSKDRKQSNPLAPQAVQKTEKEDKVSMSNANNNLTHMITQSVTLEPKYQYDNLTIDIRRMPSLASRKKKRDPLTTRFQIFNYKFEDNFEDIGEMCRFSQEQKMHLKIVMNHLQQFCRSYKVHYAIISSIKLQALLGVREFPKEKQLLDLFQNKSEIERACNLSKIKYWGDEGKMLGVVKIQSTFRMFIQKQKYRKLRLENISAAKLQSYWRGKKRLTDTRRLIKAKNTELLKRFNEIQDRFRSSWDVIKYQNRVQVHVASWGSEEIKRLQTQKLRQRQNTSITRIFRVKDPNITMVYVSPVPVSAEMVSYYKKILELVQNSQYHQRIYFVVPEVQLTAHQTLIDSVMNSPQCLSRIRDLVNNKLAYIVPGQSSMGYIKLALRLNLPIYGCIEEGRYLQLKSSIPKLLPTPRSIPQSYNIYQLQDLYASLAKLIYRNPSVERWFFKIDDQRRGRGNAYIEMKSFRQFSKLEEMKSNQYEDSILNYISIILKDKLKLKLKFVYPDLNRTYDDYMKVFLCKGGCLQAGVGQTQKQFNISVCVEIQPNNNWKILACYEKAIVHYKPIGYEFVESVVEQSLVGQIVSSIIKRSKYFGYITLDFMRTGPNYQLIGVDPYLNEATSAYFMACNFTKSANPLFFYCPLIIQNGVRELQFKTFFQFCRIQGISFDIANRSGCIFVFMDSLQSSCLGLISISGTRREMYKSLVKTFQFLHAKTQNKQHRSIFYAAYDGITLEQISHKVRVVFKRMETRQVSSHNNLLPIM